MADNREMWQSLGMDLETHDQLCVVRSPASSMPRKPKTAFPFLAKIAFFDDIVRLAREYHVDGVIDANLKFCTLYNTEKSAVAKALEAEGIPCLGLETDYTDNDAEQLRTRIEAFVEMLG